MKLEYAAKQLEALGSPNRLAIFKVLVQAGPDGTPVGQVQKQLGIPASTLSHHITKLVQAGLVTQERVSRTLFCRVDYKNMDGLMRYLLENCCGKGDYCGV